MTLTAFQIVDTVNRMTWPDPRLPKFFERLGDNYVVQAIDEAVLLGVKLEEFSKVVNPYVSFVVNCWNFERRTDRWFARGPALLNSEVFPGTAQIFADSSRMRKFLEVLRSTDFYRPEAVGKSTSLFSL